MCSDRSDTPSRCRVSPFGHLRIKAWSAAPRSFSQPPASFIGSRRQGIHRWLFVAWKNKDARARYAILKGRQAAGGRTGSPRWGAGDRTHRTFAVQRTQRTEQRTEGRSHRPPRRHTPTTGGLRGRLVASAPTGSRPPLGGEQMTP
jgi:hypothetical protein